VRKNRIFKLIFNIIVSFISVILLFCSVFYLINGSLEIEPSAEQQEKASITGWILSLGFSFLVYFFIQKVFKGFAGIRNLQNNS